jgi:hypothetical protein
LNAKVRNTKYAIENYAKLDELKIRLRRVASIY